MEIDDKAKRALSNPDVKALSIDMTGKADMFSRVAGEIHDLLRANTTGPVEAYAILHFLMKSWEDTYGIKGAIAIGGDTPAS